MRISASDLAALTATEVIDDALNLANLTRLYRISIFARGLRLSITDTLTFKALTGVDPFDVAHTADTLIFVERVAEIKSAGLSIADLDYVLRHQSEASSGMAIKDTAVAERLEDIWRDSQGGTTNEIIQRKLENVFGLEKNAVPSLEPQWTSLTEPALANVLTEINRTNFPAQFDALGRLSEAANGTTLNDDAIADRLLDIRRTLQNTIAAKEAVARKLADIFGFELSTVKLLEPQWASMGERAMADVGKDLTPSNFGKQFEDLVRLHKISKIATHFHLAAGMLEWILSHGDTQGLLDLTTLPAALANPDFPKWTRLVNLLSLRTAFSRGESALLELLEFAHQTSAPAQEELLSKLAEATNWNSVDLAFLVGANGFALILPDDLKNERALQQLRDCFAALKRLGISAEQAKSLSTDVVAWEVARSVKQAVRAKYDDAQWLSIAKPLRDVLRERQRAALVAFLVAHLKLPFPQRETPHPDLSLDIDRPPAVRELQQKLNAAGADPVLPVDGVFGPETRDAVIAFQNANGLPADGEVHAATWAELDLVRRMLRDANDLYGHFLIDVEMDPCMMTSRIKQAIGSVQLFVQRCLMNLEDEVQANSQTDDAWDWWKWMKNYRMWEANIKVFLYPENWIEPELRDDKSPFFTELESELLESDLTLDTAEKAFLNYLEKLDQVARLEVMGAYHQNDRDAYILHVFARTQAPPHNYYYRQRVNAAYWTAWKKVDLDIEGDHLIPVLWNSRLFLFWPMFMEKASPLSIEIPRLDNGGPITDKTTKYWEMKLAWSERKQGNWTGKKISSGSAMIFVPNGQRVNLSNVFFAPRLLGSDLAIHQLYDRTGTAGQSGFKFLMIDDGVPVDIATELDPQLDPHPPHEELPRSSWPRCLQFPKPVLLSRLGL